MTLETRAHYLARLNKAKLSRSVFTDYDNYNNYPQELSLNAYFVGHVYNTYYYLFHQQDYFTHYQKFNPHLTPNKVNLDQPFGRVEYTDLINFTKFCQDNKLNPVYYISTIFAFRQYRAQTAEVILHLPAVMNLVNFYSVYQNQIAYEKRAYSIQDQNVHRTLSFAQNLLIRFFDWYFIKPRKALKSSEELQLHLQPQYLIYDNEVAKSALIVQNVSPVEKQACLAYLNYMVQHPGQELLSTLTAQLWGMNQLPVFYLLDEQFLRVNYEFFNGKALLVDAILNYTFFFGNNKLNYKKRQVNIKRFEAEIKTSLCKKWSVFVNMRKLVDLLLHLILPLKDNQSSALDDKLFTPEHKFSLTKLIDYYACEEKDLVGA